MPLRRPPVRDGQHDFDFELGTWKIHLKRLLHPLTGSTTWVEFDGTSVTRNVPHFEQSFSEDWGKTWEVNWITDQTRVQGTSDRTQHTSQPVTGQR